MKVLLLNTHHLFAEDLKWGYEQLGWQAKISLNTKKEKLLQEIQEYEPDLVMTFGRPPYYSSNPQILEYLHDRGSNPGYKYIHWDTDGILSAASHQMPIILKGQPDYVFTPCKEALELYRSEAINAFIMRYGVNPMIFNKADREPKYENMITYIANFYARIISNKNYCKHKAVEVLVGGLIQNNIKIEVWGSTGMKQLYSYWPNQMSSNYYHGKCEYPDLKKIYSNSYMNIATQNGLYHISKRTYDILGAAGFALCYDIPGLREEFEVGKDLLAVNSTEEALYYINYYRKNREEYEEIKAKGHKKVSERYTYKQRLQEMLKIIRL